MDAMQKGDRRPAGSLRFLRKPTNIRHSAGAPAYLQLASKSANFQPVPDGKPINPAASDNRVPALARCSHPVGYLASQPQQPSATASARYSPRLVAAVKKLQADFGFKPDGIIGGNTLDCAEPGARRAAREAARSRWSGCAGWSATRPLRGSTSIPPRPSSTTGATDSISTTAKLSPANPTSRRPQIQAPIVHLVANPKWRVPNSIAAKGARDQEPAMARRKTSSSTKNGHYVQQSGAKNSLGLVKFDMDDKQQIYLHDTPAKALFGIPERHRSHGCVRVQNAIAFANAIATEEGVLDKFAEAMAGQRGGLRQAEEPDPGPPDLPDRILGRLQGPVSAGCLWLGRQCRAALGLVRGVHLAGGPAERRHRAVKAEGAGPSRRPHPLPTRGLSCASSHSQLRISGM